MNILNEAFHKILETEQGIFVAIATNLYEVIGIEDIPILILLSSTIVVVPVVYFVLNKYTEIYSWKKMSGLILLPVYIFIQDPKNDLDFIINLTKQAEQAGSISFFATLFFLITAIMKEPYYNGLFGRFRDYED